MTDLEQLGYLSDPLDLRAAPYQAGTVRGRRRKPREDVFTQERNAYGGELVSSQGGPEQLVLTLRLYGDGPETVTAAEDALEVVLARARAWHGLEDDSQPWLNGGSPITASEMVVYEWQTGDMVLPRRWDILSGDWQPETEMYGGSPCQVIGTLTLRGNRIEVS